MDRKPARSFVDLVAWQKAHELVLGVYRLTENFPKTEIYGLAGQFRRAAVSIPANIAEGFGKTTIKDKVRFMGYSQGSLEECRYYLILAKDLGYGDGSQIVSVLEDASRLLNRYVEVMKNDRSRELKK